MLSKYPQIEFAVLVGTHTEEKNSKRSRFPRIRIVDAFASLESCAIHLCGKYSRAVNKGDFDEVLPLVDGFGRVQVNARTKDYDPPNVALFAEKFGNQVVVQVRSKDQAEEWTKFKNIQCLFDTSGGRGKVSINEWPEPYFKHVLCGYAGGLGPLNINQAPEFVERYPDHRIWLDMETGVRTNDWFDLRKVYKVCEAAWPDGNQAASAA